MTTPVVHQGPVQTVHAVVLVDSVATGLLIVAMDACLTAMPALNVESMQARLTQSVR